MRQFHDLNAVREILMTALHESVCKVLFTKVSGEERLMECSLRIEDIPEDKRPKPRAEGDEKPSYTDATIRVFDTEKQAWRSFRVDSVKEITQIPSEVQLDLL
jgi:hypothetical protein